MRRKIFLKEKKMYRLKNIKIVVGNSRVRALSELDSFRSYYMFRNLSAFDAVVTFWSRQAYGARAMFLSIEFRS